MNEGGGEASETGKVAELPAVPVKWGRPRPFTKTLLYVSVMWGFAAGALIAIVAMTTASHIQATLLISLLSGLVAIVAMVPGLVSEWTPPTKAADRPIAPVTQDWLGSLFAGITLRLIATVALFVMCRYQLAASDEWIASLTIGWYLFMTSVEVMILVRELGKASRVAEDSDLAHEDST